MNSTFFQSQTFAEFQEKIPYRGKTWRVNGCLVVRMKLRFGRCWLWMPYGGIEGIEKFLAKLKEIAKTEKAVFARIEPGFENFDLQSLVSESTSNFYKSISPAPTRFTPEHTLILDLSKSEEKLLAEMRTKGRYNIRVAEKGVVAREFSRFEDIPPADFDEFYKILKGTSQRDEFGIHPKFFYEELLKTFGKNSSLFLAYEKSAQKVVAGIIVVFDENAATYYYGASDYEHRNLMAPYLLQWTAICEAKHRGKKWYDFLGVAPKDASENHPWAGISSFKRKFGGEEVAYPPAFDIIFQPLLYRSLTLLKKIRLA